ncbi:MAG TPA: glycoside hydrolase family 3 N-terminal domain-containing protein [Longimicrobiaceae bacterium]|nr:glycoside hydrolase family 3 N-terminal domain-containing protein [Longimicrobiaceae bacterium]
MELGRLLVPALRWDAERGFRREWDAIERALDGGVGGFIIFGGEAGAVRDLTEELHRRAGRPLLVASDLERGAGQQFRGATPLPPAAALGWLAEPETTRRAGELTAREARALGVNWVYAPVADVDLEPENPIIGVRAFGTDPDRVAEQVAAWVRGCEEGGALSCAKHFPGHGRTVGDSHVERPSVGASAAQLADDLRPFRAAVAAGTDSMMTAHVSYPALDPSGAPATLSAPILQQLLRRDLGFAGMIVTDALIMKGFVTGITEPEAAVLAMQAGCDVLLYPEDTDAIVAALAAAVGEGRLAEGRVAEALGRIDRAAERVAGGPAGQWGREEDRRWALETAIRTLRVMRGAPRLPRGAMRVVEVEDDLGGPYPPYPRTAFPAALRGAGLQLSDDGEPLVVVYSDIRAWKGRPGLSVAARERVRRALESHPDATVVLFSHPRLSDEIPAVRNLLAAWGGEALMQEAAAAWLTGERGGLPGVAAGLDR